MFKQRIEILKKQAETYLWMYHYSRHTWYRTEARKCLRMAKSLYKDYLNDRTQEINMVDYLEVA